MDIVILAFKDDDSILDQKYEKKIYIQIINITVYWYAV